MDQAAYIRETALIVSLEAKSEADMTPLQKIQHLQAIKDAYWRRRMATRTKEEVANRTCAP